MLFALMMICDLWHFQFFSFVVQYKLWSVASSWPSSRGKQGQALVAVLSVLRRLAVTKFYYQVYELASRLGILLCSSTVYSRRYHRQGRG